MQAVKIYQLVYDLYHAYCVGIQCALFAWQRHQHIVIFNGYCHEWHKHENQMLISFQEIFPAALHFI